MKTTEVNAFQAGVLLKNYLSFNCFCVEEIADQYFDRFFSGVALNSASADVLMEICYSNHFARFFSAAGQLSRKHCISLILLDCFGQSISLDQTIVDFVEGLLHGADNVYGPYLREKSACPANSLVTRIPSELDSFGVPKDIYGKAGLDDFVEISIEFVENGSKEVVLLQDLLDRALPCISILEQDACGEIINAFDARQDDVGISLSGAKGQYNVHFMSGSPLQSFQLGGLEHHSIENVASIFLRYLQKDISWWSGSHWSRVYNN